MKPPELRAALFERRHERSVEAAHTLLCLSCGSFGEFNSSTCADVDSYLLPPSFPSAIERLSKTLGTPREEVVRGLLAVALAAIERGGAAAHTRAVIFLRALEEGEAAAAAPPPGPGPKRLAEGIQGKAAKPG